MYSSYTVFFPFCLIDVSLFMSYFSLWQMSSESWMCSLGLRTMASQHTRRLAFTTWVIFTPQGQLLSSRGICLGDATNNVIEYNTVIEFLRDALSHGISHL
jgi:hypothetical protein